MSRIVYVSRSEPLPKPRRCVVYVYREPEPVKVEQGKRATYGDIQPRTFHSGGMRQSNLSAFSKGNVPDKAGPPMQRLTSRLVPVLRAVDALYDKRSKRFKLRRSARFAKLDAQELEGRKARASERKAKAWAKQMLLARKLKAAGLIQPIR